MSDFSFVQRNNLSWADMSIINGDFVQDDYLETSIMISLFSDTPASTDELNRFYIIENKGLNRGWYGNTFSSVQYGSKLWLLEREKRTQGTLDLAKQYCEEALQWLIIDGICSSIDVETSWNYDVLIIKLKINRENDDAIIKQYAYTWEAFNKPTTYSNDAIELNALNGISLRQLTEDYNGPVILLETLDESIRAAFYPTLGTLSANDYWIDEAEISGTFGAVDAYIKALYDGMNTGRHMYPNGEGYVKFYDSSVSGVTKNSTNNRPEIQFTGGDYLWYTETSTTEDTVVVDPISPVLVNDDFTELNTNKWSYIPNISVFSINDEKLRMTADVALDDYIVSTINVSELHDFYIESSFNQIIPSDGTGDVRPFRLYISVGDTYIAIRKKEDTDGGNWTALYDTTVYVLSGTSDIYSGKMRLRRSSGIIYADADTGSGWVNVMTEPLSGELTAINIGNLDSAVSPTLVTDVDYIIATSDGINGSGNPLTILDTEYNLINVQRDTKKINNLADTIGSITPESDHVEITASNIECATSIDISNQDLSIIMDVSGSITPGVQTIIDSDFFTIHEDYASGYFIDWNGESFESLNTPTGSKEYLSLVYDSSSSELNLARNGILLDTFAVTGTNNFTTDHITIGGLSGITSADYFTGSIYHIAMNKSQMYTEYPYSIPTNVSYNSYSDPLFWMNFQEANKSFSTSKINDTKRPISQYIVTTPSEALSGVLIDSGSDITRSQSISFNASDEWTLSCGETSGGVLNGNAIVSGTILQITGTGNGSTSLLAQDGTIEATGSTSPNNLYYGGYVVIGSDYNKTNNYHGGIQEALIFNDNRDTIIETNQIDIYQI